MVGEKLRAICRIGLQAVHRMMEDMMIKFVDRLAFTEEEQWVVVINEKGSALLRTNRIFLVGRVLSR